AGRRPRSAPEWFPPAPLADRQHECLPGLMAAVDMRLGSRDGPKYVRDTPMTSRKKRKKCDTSGTPQAHSYVKRSTRSAALGLGRPAPLKAALRGQSAEAQAIRILVADDHPIFRYGLHELLSTQMDFMLVGEATTGDEVFRLIDDLKPDILLVDLSMPGLSGMDVLRRL